MKTKKPKIVKLKSEEEHEARSLKLCALSENDPEEPVRLKRWAHYFNQKIIDELREAVASLQAQILELKKENE